jgi:predicted neuraminidase
MIRTTMTLHLILCAALLAESLTDGSAVGAAEPVYRAELVFPLDARHNHAPGVVQAADGSLIVSWYRGSGERRADDVAVFGARRQAGESRWSDAFPLVDTPGFPDCNTCMMIDSRDRLWLFWPTILANTWESCLTNYVVATDYRAAGTPTWSERGLVLLKPDDFGPRALAMLAEELAARTAELSPQEQAELNDLRAKVNDKLFQRLGWQPRCKPTVLPSGRILLPLYSDTFSISIMAISDDQGRSWHASAPLIGFGNIQPTVLRRNDGTVVALMRENGYRAKIRVAESTDEGETWGPVGTIDLPNPGAGIDAVRLRNGHWALVYNDTTEGRHSLAVSLSEDEGRTWRWTRHLERQAGGQFHYPAVIEGTDGLIHVVYSYFVPAGKSMKHAEFNEPWIQQPK